jgi:threonine synthase
MMGLAEDGGLIVPSDIPNISADELKRLSKLTYPGLAYEIIKLFATDIEPEILKNIINKSYAAFDTDEVIPVVKKDGIHIAELFHGPTFAFKDVALQFLGNLFEHILEERGEKLNIIGATSGDTGSAAIYGVRGRKNIRIFILHPKGRVSPVQEMQMTSVTDDNVFNLAVDGTFDDCQDIVKEIFGDVDFKKKHSLGAVNSINWARVLAQIVYYFWCRFRTETDGKVSFVVPTGNFGNIFAGYFAKQMGLPIDKLILATNENNILTRFIMAGDYSQKDVVKTYSPSMDIQIASNFERYLYFLYKQDAAKVDLLMKALKAEKAIRFPENDIVYVQEDFDSYSASNPETVDIISKFYKEYSYMLDPHTACGVAAALRHKNGVPLVCLATAHPAKFPEVVVKATGTEPEKPEGIRRLESLERRIVDMPCDTAIIKEFVSQNV